MDKMVFTNALAKITGINGRLLSVKPIGAFGGVQAPEIHDVPLGLIGNKDNYSDYHLKVGDIVPILFTSMDIGNYISFGSEDTVSSTDVNSYNSCIALPITFNLDQLKMQLPNSISSKGDIEHEGTNKTTKDITSGTKVEAPLVNGEDDVMFAGISGKKHKHGGVQGGPSDTGGPKQ